MKRSRDAFFRHLLGEKAHRTSFIRAIDWSGSIS